jgi:hypothetical protein
LNPNLRNQLLAELSRRNTDYIIHVIGDDEDYFDEIIRMVQKEKDPLPPRAAWVADGASLKYPYLIEKHIPALVSSLPEFTHPGTRRNILKILSRCDIPENVRGDLIDHCFQWLVDRNEPVAVKVYGMQIIANHLSLYPELGQELRNIIEDQFSRSSPGFQAKGRKILKLISKTDGL